MLLASCGSELKFHKWSSGTYHGSFQFPEIGPQKPSISWCNNGEVIATSVSPIAFPTLLYVEKTVQTHMIIDVPQVQCVSFSQTIQNQIMLGTTEGTVLLYDIQTQEVINALPSLPVGIKHLEHGSKDLSVAACGENDKIYLYDSKYRINSIFCMPYNDKLTAMSYPNTQPQLLAAGGTEGTVIVWDSNTADAIIVDKPHTNTVTDMTFFSPDEVITVGLDQKFIGHDLRSKSNTFSCNADSKLSAVRILPTGTQIVVASMDGKLHCYDKRSINLPFSTILTHYPKPIFCIAFQYGFVPDDVDILSQTASKVTTVVSNPYVKSACSATSVIKIHEEELTPTGDHKAKKHSDLKVKSNAKTHSVASATNFESLVMTNTVNVHQDKALNRPKAVTDLLNTISCATNEINRTFENNIRIIQTKTVEGWMRKIPKHTSRGKLKKDDIAQVTKELIEFTKNTFDILNESVSKEFVKIRWSISKQFIKLENKINVRWEELNSTLMHFSGCDMLENIGDSKTRFPVESSKIEKISDNDDGDNCGSEQKSRIPVPSLSTK